MKVMGDGHGRNEGIYESVHTRRDCAGLDKGGTETGEGATSALTGKYISKQNELRTSRLYFPCGEGGHLSKMKTK